MSPYKLGSRRNYTRVCASLRFLAMYFLIPSFRLDQIFLLAAHWEDDPLLPTGPAERSACLIFEGGHRRVPLPIGPSTLTRDLIPTNIPDLDIDPIIQALAPINRHTAIQFSIVLIYGILSRRVRLHIKVTLLRLSSQPWTVVQCWKDRCY